MSDKRKVSPERRREIAQKAALARWGRASKPIKSPIRTLADIEKFCMAVATANNLAADYYDRAGGRDVMEVAAARAVHVVLLGLEVGLQPGQALASIIVRNGMPLIRGDAQLALVLHSGKAAYVREELTQDAATCITLRAGDAEPYVVRFTVEDAKAAGLWATAGAWTTHPGRCMKYKARGFCLRDKYPDVIKGLAHSTEEMEGEITRQRDGSDIAPHDAAKKLTGIIDNRKLHNTSEANKGE